MRTIYKQNNVKCKKWYDDESDGRFTPFHIILAC